MEHDVLTLLTATVTGDATYRTLTGYSIADPRWYYFYKGDALVDTSHPVYATYMMTTSPESGGGVRPPVVSVILWGKRRDLVLAVRNRLHALLDRKTLTTTTGRRVRTRIVGESDTYQQEGDFVGRQMQVRMAYLDAFAS